jgi:hypothetical protein
MIKCAIIPFLLPAEMHPQKYGEKMSLYFYKKRLPKLKEAAPIYSIQ